MEIIYTENPLAIIVNLDKRDREIIKRRIEAEPNKHADVFTFMYEVSLGSVHMGDCTHIPATCDKCHAEIYLGIDTLGKLSPGAAYYIQDAFSKNDTCENAINSLKRNPPTIKESWHEKHINRWTDEHQEAIQYLENYLKSKLAQ